MTADEKADEAIMIVLRNMKRVLNVTTIICELCEKESKIEDYFITPVGQKQCPHCKSLHLVTD